MPRIAIASDLHIEFERRGPPEPEPLDGLHPAHGPDLLALHGEVDLLVLAGDIDVGVYGIHYARQAAGFLGVPVVYVLGNHETYGHDLDMIVAECRRQAADSNEKVFFLEQDSVEVAGIRVLGCTLWTDYAVNGGRGTAMRLAGINLNDHRLIKCGGRRFTPDEALARHRIARSWLENELARGNGQPTVVVTHHAPVRAASAPEHEGSALEPAFVSDLEGVIGKYEPAAWVWGHTHHSVDFHIGETRCISAQRGYIDEDPRAAGFRPAIINV